VVPLLDSPSASSTAAITQAPSSAICGIGPRVLTRPARRTRIVSPGLRGVRRGCRVRSWERTV
jgi:hypothetical protein